MHAWPISPNRTKLTRPGSSHQIRPAMGLLVACISILATGPLLLTATTLLFIFFIHLSVKSSRKEELEKEEEGPVRPDESEMSLISANDGSVVLRRLGLWRGEDGGLEGAYRLLEEKEASMEELEEAFAVFDEDGDGVISANEVGNVLRRLGFGEGTGLEEDCRGIICCYDLDGDGGIGFEEFKCLLEQAT